MSNRSNRFQAVPPGAALVLAALLTGCQEESVRVYQVPKEQPRVQLATTPHGASPHGADRPAAPTAHLHWETLPPNWRDRPVSGVMRAAEFGIRGDDGQTAEMAVFALPEVRGMELEFVNMWREQISLAPTTTASVAELRETVTIAGEPGQLFDMAGDTPAEAGQVRPRTIVAMYSVEGTTWLFKLTGPDALVAGEKQNLKNFLAKVDLHAEPHGGDPHAGPADAATAAPGVPQWIVPSGWKQTTPGPMVLASFDLPGGNAKVTVSSLGGDGGGLLLNVNRWRDQIALGPVSAAQLPEVTSELETAAGKATLVDLQGEGRRMLTLIVPHQGRSWYYKALGETGVIDRERDAFLQFARSAQY